jgi:hypothetical protein
MAPAWLALSWMIVMSAGEGRGKPDLPTPKARIETSLETEGEQIRQYAFDGDLSTSFVSKANPKKSDEFTLVFDRPISMNRISVVTGKEDHGIGLLSGGSLEISSDGKTFQAATEFSNVGSAKIDLSGVQVLAIRVKPSADMDHPLAIREIQIESDQAPSFFRHPVEFMIDVSDAPEMKDWAENVAKECESAYPWICDYLETPGYKPPRVVHMSLSKQYDGVAAASGNKVTGSVDYFTKHPNDVGAMIHETVHVVQQYRGRRNPSWLVEGTADYLRFFIHEPEKLGPINAEKAHFNGSYRVSAAFLAYLVENFDERIVQKLNATMRSGTYSETIFHELTGRTLAELDDDWRASLADKPQEKSER